MIYLVYVLLVQEKGRFHTGENDFVMKVRLQRALTVRIRGQAADPIPHAQGQGQDQALMTGAAIEAEVDPCLPRQQNVTHQSYQQAKTEKRCLVNSLVKLCQTKTSRRIL